MLLDDLALVADATNMGAIGLHDPLFNSSDYERVTSLLDSGIVSTYSKSVDDFEMLLSSYLGVGNAVATVSGTSALTLALKALGLPHGSGVICPAYTFVASVSSIVEAGLVPVFCDVDEVFLNLSSLAIERFVDQNCTWYDKVLRLHSGLEISAVMFVHCYGNSEGAVQVKHLTDELNLKMVEDAAEALGSSTQGYKAGLIGDVAAISFNGNKLITTGGGGALVSNDSELIQECRSIATTGRYYSQDLDAVIHRVGCSNLRMPGLNAALGIGQLQRLDSILEVKRQNRLLLDRIVTAKCNHLRVPVRDAGANCWLNYYLVDAVLGGQLFATVQQIISGARGGWVPVHLFPEFARFPAGDLPISQSLHGRVICMPSGLNLVFGND